MSMRFDSEGRKRETDGELRVRDPGAASGYYNLPDVTERMRRGSS